MAIKTLLVHIDNSKHCAARLDVTIDLAKKFDAHLIGVYAIPHPYIMADMSGGYVPAELIEQQMELGRDAASEAETAFNTHMQGAAMEAEWRCAEGYAGAVISQNARYADLTIVGQPDPDDTEGYPDPDLPAEVTLTSGRPVLVVPYIGVQKTLGKNVVVAWNATRESTRAVYDALPLLLQADNVSVLAVNPGKDEADHGDVPGADISLQLARHGVKAEATKTFSDDLEVSDVILSRIADTGADLLVMGAYGHSRMREWAMGGATREILRHMTVPVLMSH
jgi:nucleotide-binding universal stress UspA family protein